MRTYLIVLLIVNCIVAEETEKLYKPLDKINMFLSKCIGLSNVVNTIQYNAVTYYVGV